MEGIDLAGVVDSDFQGIQINFAPPRPAGFANIRGAGRGSPFFAGRGGVGRTSLVLLLLDSDMSSCPTEVKSNNNIHILCLIQ